MYFSSIRVDEVRLRLTDLVEGLNVVYLPSPDKRRMIAAAARGVFQVRVEEPCRAAVSLQTNWGNYRLEVDTSLGERLFSEIPRGCSVAEAVRRLETVCSAESFSRVCSPRLGDVLALQETAYHVCGAAIAGQLRSAWEKFIHELEWSQAAQSNSAEIRQLREERAELRARLGMAPPHRSRHLSVEERRRWVERWYVCRYAIRRLKAIAAQCQDAQRREQLKQRLRRWQRYSRSCSEKLGVLSAPTVDVEQAPAETRAVYARLREVENRLRHLEKVAKQQAARWLDRVQQLLEQPVRSPVLQRASQLLAELSGGQLLALHTVQMGKELVVEQPNQKRLSCDVLNKAERVLVHLSLCLSAIEAAFEAGCSLPLLINDSLRYLPTAQLRTVIEALRRHARQYGQVLLLTGQPHLAALCRSLGIAVHALGAPADHVPDVAVVAAEPARAEQAWQKTNFSPVPTDPALRLGTTESERPLEPHDIAGAPPQDGSPGNWLAGAQRVSNASATGTRSASGTWLSSTATIDRLDWVPARVLELIKNCGILTVSALLRAEPSCVVARSESAITVEQMERYQAEARLLCRVPGLKPYDARVLVACGITTPEQLAQLHPIELYRLVESLLATPEGSDLIRSGTSDDIQRLTRWLRQMRANRPQRHAGLESRSHVSVHHADTLPYSKSGPKTDVRSEHVSEALSTSGHRTDGTGRDVEILDPGVVVPSGETTDDHAAVQTADVRQWPLERLPGLSRSLIRKLAQLGIIDLTQLLDQSPDRLAAAINRKTVGADTVERWQQLARLLVALPGLQPIEAQLLLLAGVGSAEQLRSCEAHALYLQLQRAARTAKGRKLLANHDLPSLQQVANWIAVSQQARHSKAA
ncbi:MAG: hypothetical protein KatS3mg110_0356 [Pirellulaceae bacterium]|nr:MAG: hypothetical protein KatS3mg110_0356 [Pirellulaceae bacterium]